MADHPLNLRRQLDAASSRIRDLEAEVERLRDAVRRLHENGVTLTNHVTTSALRRAAADPAMHDVSDLHELLDSLYPSEVTP